MKKLPKFIFVFGRKIPIKSVNSKAMLKMYPDYHQAPQGLWDSCKREIVINKDFPIKDQFYTLSHELAHCAKTFVGLDLILDASIQEIIVQTMATLIEDILNQSSKLK